MKKMFFLLPITAAVLVSCSNSETVSSLESDAIEFRTLMDGHTRGNVVTISNLNQFKVMAQYSTTTAMNFTDLVATPDNGGSWSTSNVHYWKGATDGEVVKFTAFSPTDLPIADYGATITDFQPASDAASQKDVIVAYQEGSKTANQSSGVALNFKHVLSQVSVQATCKASFRIVKVLGIKFVNIPTKATFTLPTSTTWTPGNWAFASGTPDRATYGIKGNSPITLTSTAQDLMFGNGSMMLIPQTLPGGTVNTDNKTTATYISVLVQINDYDSSTGETTQTYPDNSGKYAYVAVPISETWQPGYKYVYTLNFFQGDGGAGLVDPNPENPNDADDDDVDNDPTNKEPGSDVDGDKAIFFTVDISEWNNASVDKQMD